MGEGTRKASAFPQVKPIDYQEIEQEIDGGEVCQKRGISRKFMKI